MVIVYYPKKGDIIMGYNHRRCRPRCRPNCGCQGAGNEIVYPVKENVVNCCTEETVKHIHPSHTTVKNHHLIKNEHYYPHTTSTENFENEVEVQGASTGPGMGGGPGMGMGPGNQVGGAMTPGGGHGHHHGHCHKHNSCKCHSCRRRRRRF